MIAMTRSNHAPIGYASYKQRDKAIIDWLRIHPSTVLIIALLFFQGRLQKAYRRTQKLRKRGLIECIGLLRLGDGRPADFYSGWQVKEDLYFHEYHLTRFAACYPDAGWTRGYDTDRTLRPDAEMRVDDETYYVELHTGTMRGDKARSRFDVYRDTRASVLWVTLDHSDVDYLLELAPSDNHWVAPLDVIEADPQGQIWINNRGEQGWITGPNSPDRSCDY